MPNFAQRWTLLALVLTLLTACGTASSNPACVCPPIKEYSREFQDKLAAEIETAPQDAAFPEALQDYELERIQISAGCK